MSNPPLGVQLRSGDLFNKNDIRKNKDELNNDKITLDALEDFHE